MQVPMKKNVKHRLIPLLSILLVLFACDLPASSVSSASTPVAPGAIETIIFETAAAAQTQTAEFLPPTQTPTRPPTSTATLTKTPLPTSTVLFLFPTNTHVVLPTLPGCWRRQTDKTPNPNEHDYKGTLACAVVGQSPSDGTAFKPRKEIHRSLDRSRILAQLPGGKAHIDYNTWVEINSMTAGCTI